MYKVYILKSLSIGSYYIGHAEDLGKRLKRHNKGLVRSTKRGLPWIVVYVEEYKTKQEAYKRELQVKSYKGGRAFKKLLKLG